ncbi:Lactation elevated protein 1 [Gracilariopsis chorda]|uniref:Lactation elevated protein 1 n=1 Tax=Gracilariopsis chorda TaxID=448386 RepID=A0A2V3J258_9FLOR|nr:Lactation elevated protein 1 [Gracilariopsis chorda]|eukprot:PXF48459.1 Lactation elevated protein 1 [Gracilariopsis chorda]
MQQLAPIMQTLQRVARLPSHLHAAAVQNGALRYSVPQQHALPRLDDLVHKLPPYIQQMESHADKLLDIEQARHDILLRENARLARFGTVGDVWRKLRYVANRIPPDTPIDALPNHYFGLPEAPPAPESPTGLYLHGDVGCGKSLLMDMLFTCSNDVLSSCARVHYHTFMISVYQMLHEYDSLTKRERAQRGLFHPLDAVVGRLGRANAAGTGGGLLCFDEFQVADVADARLMHGILGRLMQSGTIVCFTANRAPADLNRSQLQATDFLPFLDLLHDRCELIHLRGVDYRALMSEQDQGQRLYYAPHEEEQVKEFWRQTTGREWDEVVSAVWPVAYGRQFHAQRVGANAVQLTTEELIEAAVGAADYRAIANNVSTIFVTDIVPVFASDTRNFARRFITLIDVCYENKVRIVMRTDAKDLDDMFSGVRPGADHAEIAEGLQFETEMAKEGVGADNRAVSSSTLYTGEDEAFAFRRAISRLKEMQTTGFGVRSPFQASLSSSN